MFGKISSNVLYAFALRPIHFILISKVSIAQVTKYKAPGPT